jgi:alkanesulfonate monooxygenase SsuD/methylene tetrahydromethanopterin reductase-like flavin-dependent oxidoreductase (luciferase family)
MQPMDQDGRADVEFGLFDWIDAAPGLTTAEVYDGRLRILAEADKAGFSVYHLAEHHGTPLGLAPSPALFVAAAARVTERIRLAPTTFVVPLYDPLRLAEEIAMLDQLSGGRLEVGFGKGGKPL